MKQKYAICLTLAIIFTVVFFGTLGFSAIDELKFTKNCDEYLERVAYSKDVSTAKDSLKQAIQYAEVHGFTEGSTSVLIDTPKNDVGYWFESLKSSYQMLNDLDENATALEKSNVLMQVKESLLDHQGCIVAPEFIELFPHNTLYTIIFTLTSILSIVFWCLTHKYSCFY